MSGAGEISAPELEDLSAARAEIQREKDALRIQAAAVAAQQAAVTEEEVRLQQRRLALDQHEQQLAFHLEEKRTKLLALRDEAKGAREDMQRERALFEKRVARTLRRIAARRSEISASQEQVRTDRRRLLDLRGRLKKRYHRYWAGERAELAAQEAELIQRESDVANAAERLKQERAAIADERLRAAAEIELARRQLQEEKNEVQVARNDVEERVHLCIEQEAILTEDQRRLDAEVTGWQGAKVALKKEIDGLESRIGHYRRRVQEKEQELARLEAHLAKLGPNPPAPTVGDDIRAAEGFTFVATPAEPPSVARTANYEPIQRLEQLAAELSDQRLYLAEQYARLREAHDSLNGDRAAVMREIDHLAGQLEERDRLACDREETIERKHVDVEQKVAGLDAMRRQLEGWRAQITADASAAEVEHARAESELRARRRSVDEQIALLAGTRERWHERRRSQVVRIRKIMASYRQLERDCFVQREQWLQRRLMLDQEQRSLAERALALEQFRQECIVRSHNPKAAEKRLEQLRRRCAAAYASAERTLARERQVLSSEANRLDQRSGELDQEMHDLNGKMAEFSEVQAAWEQQQTLMECERNDILAEAHGLRGQIPQYERQLRLLQDEVERIARLLMDEGQPATTSFNRAA
jgi:chromosome segregation ATPase